MRSRLLLAALGLLVAGCSGSRPLPPPEPPPPSLAADDLYGTVWKDVCDDTVYWVRLNNDGSLDFTTSSASGPWDNDGTDTWSLEGSVLTISWSDGYRVVSFDLPGGLDGRTDGVSTGDCELVYLERAG